MTINSKAQGNIQIDQDGNLILVEEEREKKAPPLQPQSSAESPSAPSPSPERPEDPFRVSDRKKAFVVTRILDVTASTQENSNLVVKLKQGDQVFILQEYPDHYEVEYLLEEEFPVTGFVPKAAIQLAQADATRPEAQGSLEYEPEARDVDVVTKVQALPQAELPEQDPAEEIIRNPPPQMSPLAGAPQKDNELKFDLSKAPRRFEKNSVSFLYDFSGYAGFTRFQESITSQGQSEAFLDYELNGIQVGARGGFLYQLKQFRAGAHINYSASIYDAEVGGAQTGIVESSVQAQRHRLQIAARILKAWSFIPQIIFEPEARMGMNFELFSTNQLRNASTPAMAVLFGYTAYFVSLDIIPRLYLPYNFRLDPIIRVLPYYGFSQTNTERLSTNALIATGNPKASSFHFGYGAQLYWDLAAVGLKQFQIHTGIMLEQTNRKFSGQGNQAGRLVENAKSKVDIMNISLGLEYLF